MQCKKITVSLIWPILLMVPLLVFFQSYYVAGDQYRYAQMFNAISTSQFTDIFLISKHFTGAFEPIFPVIMWLFKHIGLEKIYFDTVLSVGLLFFLILLVRQSSYGAFTFFVLALSFYSLVIFFAASKLKLGFLFLSAALYFSESRGKDYLVFILLSLAVLSHIQLALFFPVFISNINFSRLRKSQLFWVISLIFVVFIFGYLFQDRIIKKINFYFDSEYQVLDLSLLVMCCLALFIVSRKQFLRFVPGITPLAVAIIFFGGDRLNLMVYFAIIFTLLKIGRMYHPIFFPFHFYFFSKSYFFLGNIIFYGQGYKQF